MLSIENLVRRIGSNSILNGFSLDVPTGSVACLVGPSGCGKSTLLRLVAGLDRPDEGRISIADTTVSSPGWALEPRRRRLNMVFQDYALWPHMKVRQIVGYGLNRVSTAEREARVAGLLDLLRIGDLGSRFPSQLSGGQQQRVAIARALATDPDLLLLDEPLSNLDVQLRLEMRREFSELFAALGKTVLYVTHDPLEACAFADILVVMNGGAIEQLGPPEALFAAPRSAWIATLAGYDTRLEGRVLGPAGAQGCEIAIGGQRLRARKPAGQAQTGAAAKVMLHPGRITLGAPIGAAADNLLAGTVKRALLEGAGWRIDIDIDGQNVSMLHRQRLSPGEKVSVGFACDEALVFPL